MPAAERARPQLPNLFGKLVDHLSESGSLRGADPLQPKTPFLQAQEPDQAPGALELLDGAMVAKDVVAVSEVAPGDQNTVGSILQGAQSKPRLDAP